MKGRASKLHLDENIRRVETFDDCTEYIQRIAFVRDAIQGKWRLEILCAMREEPVRLSRLTRLLPAASKKALRADLRSLEEAGIVSRRDLSHAVLHVEYDFKENMRDVMCNILDNLASWSELLKPGEDAQLRSLNEE